MSFKDSAPSSQSTVIELNDQKPSPQKGAINAGGARGPSGPVSDLFNAHNFDVDIDIAIPGKHTSFSEYLTKQRIKTSEFHCIDSQECIVLNNGVLKKNR